MNVNKFVVVDYQQGAGGEFIANWLSAHWGHALEFDLQHQPNYLQKWFNSHSLIKSDWDENFSNYVSEFDQMCGQHSVHKIAVSYHCYKWPHHVEILTQQLGARFVRINCKNYEQTIYQDFCRKVLDRPLTKADFHEIQFMLRDRPMALVTHCMDLLSKGQLCYRDIVGDLKPDPRTPPSQDIEIDYESFFVDFNQTAAAYQTLCQQLGLEPQAQLLDALIQRNKKNLLQQQGT